MHSWGGSKKEGFYSNLAKRSGVNPLKLFEVKEQIPQIGPNKAFEYVCLSLVINKLKDNDNHPELVKRNEAFVALTRSKVWCVVTGLEDKIFDEMEKIILNIPNITFPAFNKTSLSRITEDIS